MSEQVTLAPGNDLATDEFDELAPRLLALVRSVANELRPHARLAATLGLDDSLERDYGLDSLARVELFSRIDHELGVTLGEDALTGAETPRDLLRYVAGAQPRGAALVRPLVAPGAAPPPVADDEYPPDGLATLLQIFDWHLQRHADRGLITLYEDGGKTVELSYAALHADGVAMAAGLRELGLEPGDRVAIMLPTGREFFAAFFGALLAGMVPVPLYPPARPSQLEDHLRRVAGILRNAQARVMVTVERAMPLAQLLRAQVESLRSVSTVAKLSRSGAPWERPQVTGSDLAFLQYTSGSTGDPKGVLLTHANLLANLRVMWRSAGVSSRDVFVSWLPLYHDMGLIGACLGALVLGFRLVLMSPLAFLAQPARWLQAIHRHRGTVSAAPNFAFELCASKLTDGEIDGLDLSSWRLAFNGAEPVSPDTLERFAARFARCGFARETLFPVYGLAENSLGLTFPPPGRGPLIDRIDRTALARDGLAVPARPDDEHPMRIVSCGSVLPGHELRVVDTAGRELPEREQGRVQFRGPSATQGYLSNPAAQATLFDGSWLNSGDLGYLAGGELYLTGREKDIVIRGGFNIHPQELETAVAATEGVRKGGVAVFASTDARSGTERLVVLAETKLQDPAARRQLVQAITALSATLLGAPADDVVLAPPRSVLKTSSGKTRRAACRELYEQGRLGVTQRAPWQQWLSLAGAAAAARVRRAWRTAGQRAWGLWAWIVVAALGTLAWCAVMVLADLSMRRRVARALTRATIGLIGLPVRVHGLDHLPAHGPCVVVANHASYADSLLLIAVLPPRFSYAAKRELASAPMIGIALQRLGIAFVEREQAAQGVEDVRALQARARAGESFVFFPEGTFGRASGLQTFKLGAFIVATAAETPVVPLTLNGTRSLLRDDSWWPRRHPIGVTIGAPLVPAGTGWDSALALREAARRAIAAQLAGPA